MDKFFVEYNIHEIENKTHISPVVLNKLKEFDFDGITKVKLYGFVKILEDEYPEYDFSDLKNEVDLYFSDENNIKDSNTTIDNELDEENNFKMYAIVVVLIIMISALIYFIQKDKEIKTSEIKNVSVVKDKNLSENTSKVIDNNKTTQIKNNNSKLVLDKNISKDNKSEINRTLLIKPLQKVWFKLYNLDKNTSKEYLTNKVIEINNTTRSFIKFGHGQVKLVYNNKEFFPNSKKIVRVIIENNEINITKKRLKEFK